MEAWGRRRSRTDCALDGLAAGRVEAALLEFPAALVKKALRGAKAGAGHPRAPVLALGVLAPPRVLVPLLRLPPRATVVALGVVAGPLVFAGPLASRAVHHVLHVHVVATLH